MRCTKNLQTFVATYFGFYIGNQTKTKQVAGSIVYNYVCVPWFALWSPISWPRARAAGAVIVPLASWPKVAQFWEIIWTPFKRGPKPIIFVFLRFAVSVAQKSQKKNLPKFLKKNIGRSFSSHMSWEENNIGRSPKMTKEENYYWSIAQKVENYDLGYILS